MGEDRHGTVRLRFATSAKVPAGLIESPDGGGARFDGRDHRRRLGFQIDDRDLIIGCGFFFRIGRVELDRAGHQRDAFVPGYGDALWRTDDARRSLQLGNHFRRLRREGRMMVTVSDAGLSATVATAVDEDGLVVVRGYGRSARKQ